MICNSTHIIIIIIGTNGQIQFRKELKIPCGLIQEGKHWTPTIKQCLVQKMANND